MIKVLLMFLVYFGIAYANNDNLQDQLMSIASREAQIAEIGANKVPMLYGTGDVFVIINRWNKIQNKPKLNVEQIEQIKLLEQQKQQIISQARYGK